MLLNDFEIMGQFSRKSGRTKEISFVVAVIFCMLFNANATCPSTDWSHNNTEDYCYMRFSGNNGAYVPFTWNEADYLVKNTVPGAHLRNFLLSEPNTTKLTQIVLGALPLSNLRSRPVFVHIGVYGFGGKQYWMRDDNPFNNTMIQFGLETGKPITDRIRFGSETKYLVLFCKLNTWELNSDKTAHSLNRGMREMRATVERW